ncbi:MAG: hypothetical protein WD114_03370 [Phycisphaerales bacterium]
MKPRSTIAPCLALAAGFATAGPDLICSEIDGATSFGVVDKVAAYSFGTTLCNIGDEPVSYAQNTNQHPLIAQSIYKLKDHRIEQIGIGFVRHPTIPLPGNACGLGCTPGAIDELGPGCSDVNSSTTNGGQAMMGPRTEVEAYFGDYPYPFTSINQTGDAIYKRVQVELADVSDPDALYFVETQLIVPDETMPEERNNNVSYRQVTFTPGSATAAMVGPTYDRQPAIFAWRDHGNGIGVPDAEVLIDEIEMPRGGLIHVGSRVTEDPDNFTYRYEYAIHNQNSSRQIAWFEHSAGDAETEEFTFDAPAYHDDLDEQIDGQAWAVELSVCASVLYRQAVGFHDDPNANTIRWGTTYGFGFTNRNEPYIGTAETMRIGYGGPTDGGEPNIVFAQAHMPLPGEFFCWADLNEDGQLNFFDLSAFIQRYNAGGDYNNDGETNFFDLSAFLTDFNAGCCF